MHADFYSSVLDIFPTTTGYDNFFFIDMILFCRTFVFCSCNAYFLFSHPLPSQNAWRFKSQRVTITNIWRNLDFKRAIYGSKWMKTEILEKLDDGVFVRTLQCLAAAQKSQQNSHGKEPSLMPVPSPQQISYLNQFEGNGTTRIPSRDYTCETQETLQMSRHHKYNSHF